jgi:predicted PurR-regulated permease PerM
LEFIPIIGPLAAAAPALLIAFGEGGTIILTTILLYIIVQQIESNVVTPMLQRRIVHIPPVILLFSFVALGVVFGIAGIIVAAPLSVALFILVREFYVADLLGERAELEVVSAAPAPDQNPAAAASPRQRKRRQRPSRAAARPVLVRPALD